MMMVQHHEAAYWTQKCIDSFDRLYQEGAERPQDHGDRDPSLHQRPAVPHQVPGAGVRLHRRFPGVLHWNGEQILDWYLKAKKHTA